MPQRQPNEIMLMFTKVTYIYPSQYPLSTTIKFESIFFLKFIPLKIIDGFPPEQGQGPYSNPLTEV